MKESEANKNSVTSYEYKNNYKYVEIKTHIHDYTDGQITYDKQQHFVTCTNSNCPNEIDARKDFAMHNFDNDGKCECCFAPIKSIKVTIDNEVVNYGYEDCPVLTSEIEVDDLVSEDDMSYQWYDGNGDKIVDAISKSYTFLKGLGVGQYKYKCRISYDDISKEDEVVVTVIKAKSFIKSYLDKDSFVYGDHITVKTILNVEGINMANNDEGQDNSIYGEIGIYDSEGNRLGELQTVGENGENIFIIDTKSMEVGNQLIRVIYFGNDNMEDAETKIDVNIDKENIGNINNIDEGNGIKDTVSLDGLASTDSKKNIVNLSKKTIIDINPIDTSDEK